MYAGEMLHWHVAFKEVVRGNLSICLFDLSFLGAPCWPVKQTFTCLKNVCYCNYCECNSMTWNETLNKCVRHFSFALHLPLFYSTIWHVICRFITCIFFLSIQNFLNYIWSDDSSTLALLLLLTNYHLLRKGSSATHYTAIQFSR